MFSAGFLWFYAYSIKYLKKNVIFVFHELYRINYTDWQKKRIKQNQSCFIQVLFD